MSKFYICVSKIFGIAIRPLNYEIPDKIHFLLLCCIHTAG
jgi:hypothetical protein